MPSIDSRTAKPKRSSSKNSLAEASNDDTFDADSFVVRRKLPAPEGEESSVVKFDTTVKKPPATTTTTSIPKLTLPTMPSSSKHKSSSRGSSGSGEGSGVTGKSNTSSSRETPVASNNNDRSSRNHHRSTPDYSDNDDDTTSLAELTSYGSSHADLHPHHKQRRSTKESTHQGEESDMDREGRGRHSSSRHRSSGRGGRDDGGGGRDKSANRRRKAGYRNSDTEDDYGNETEDSSALQHRHKHNRHSSTGRYTSRSSRSRGSTSSGGGGGILSTLTSPFTLVWRMFEGINLKTVTFCMMGVALLFRMESVHHQGHRALGTISGSSPLIRDPVEVGNPGIRGATVPTVANTDDIETEDNNEGGNEKKDFGEEEETKESDEGGETIELGNDVEGEDDMAEQPPPPPAEEASYSQPIVQEPMEQQPMEQQPMEQQVGAVNQVQQYDPQQQQAGSMNQAQQFSPQQQQFSPQQQQFSPQQQHFDSQQQQQQGAFPQQQQQFDPQQQQQQIQGQYPAAPQVQQSFVQANGIAAAVPGTNPAFASGGVAFPQQQQMIQTGQIDPQTGQPMAQQIDPQTGQPVTQQFDPQAGQPVAQQFDPQTGQMIQSMPQQNTGMGVPGAGAIQSPLEWQQQQQQQQGQTPMSQQQFGGAMGLDQSQQMQQQPPQQQQVDQFGNAIADASSQMSPQQDAQMGQPQQQQVDQFGNAAVDASSQMFPPQDAQVEQPQDAPPVEQPPQEAPGQVIAVDPAAPAGDAAVAPTASGSPQESILGLLSNFKDTWDPYDNSDIPMFWHIPKAGGSSIKDTMGGCHRFVQATEFGVTDGHGAETEVAIVYPAVPGVADTDRSPFVNIDSTTVAGIARAKQMGFADANLAQLVVSPFVFETNDLFTPTAKGRLFSVFRHPIERAVSMFYYIQVADWEPSYKPELKDWTMSEYATSDIVENNWMTRQLSNQLGGELTEENLNKAMEVVRTKFLVGLMSQIERTMSRVEKFFRMTYHVNPTNQEACRNRLMSGGSNSNSKNKKPFTEEDPAWALLAHQNNFDMQLYSYIEALFEEQDAFVEGIPDEFRKIDGTCCKCDPPTFPPEGFTCPQAVKNDA